MGKLTGAKKAAFLERMAKGRKKARKVNPKGQQKKIFKTESGAVRFAEKVGGFWTWNGTSGINARWYVYYLPKQNPNVRRTKKTIGKGFGKHLAAEHTRTKRAAAKKRPHQRRNSDDNMAAAERKFEEFHGKPATRVIDYETAYRYPEHFAEMGKLVELRVDLDKLNPDFPIVKFKGTQAVCTPDGLNIYFIGGDQSVDFEAMNITSDKDFVELGPCKYICYDTVKGFHDFQQTDYWHLFGEEDDIFPVLVYDRLNKGLFLVGGNYRVRPEGIVN